MADIHESYIGLSWGVLKSNVLTNFNSLNMPESGLLGIQILIGTGTKLLADTVRSLFRLRLCWLFCEEANQTPAQLQQRH